MMTFVRGARRMAEICYNTDCPYCEHYQCKRSCTCITQLTDGYWYHGNGKLGGEFCPNKPNDKERYGEYVKVVRCKDCKHFEPTKDTFGACEMLTTYMHNNGYCSWGERKDEVEE